jgi:hypothetical protein
VPKAKSSVALKVPYWLSAIQRFRVAHPDKASDLEEAEASLLHGGIRLDFLEAPSTKVLQNSNTVRNHLSVATERIKYYESIDAIKRLAHVPKLLQPLHMVLKPGKKPRLVLDCSRNLNDVLRHKHFKYQSLQDAVDLSTPGCYYGKHDISDCFLSFPVHADHQHYLAFELEDKYYKFTRLPFGLKSAPRICEQLMSIVSFVLNEHGIDHVRYVDDFFYIHKCHLQLAKNMRKAESIFAAFGLLLGADKTVEAAQVATFVGVGFDSVDQILFCTEERTAELLSLIDAISACGWIKVKQAQSLTGKFSFAAHCIPGARPFFRRIIDATREARGKQTVLIDVHFLADLYMWRTFLTSWNRRGKWVSTAPAQIDHDSSKSGFGFSLMSLPPGFDPSSMPAMLLPGTGFSGRFSEQHLPMALRDIQWGELFAIVFAFCIYAPFLRNLSVILKTDNLADVSIVNRQSTKSPELLVLLRALYWSAAVYNINIRAEHIAGILNTFPDYLSRPNLHQFAPARTFTDVVCITRVPIITFVSSSVLQLTELSGTPAASTPLLTFSRSWISGSIPELLTAPSKGVSSGSAKQ